MPFLAAITVLIETYWNVKKETKVIDKSSIKY